MILVENAIVRININKLWCALELKRENQIVKPSQF
jgi:hypothetical protein